MFSSHGVFDKKVPGVPLSHYLDPKLITILQEETRDEALLTLVDLLDKAGKLQDKTAFYHAILEREKIVSTGVGMGVAVPHAKLVGYKDFFVALGIHPRGLPWGALDGIPVRIIFLIGGPEDRQTQYLQLLSRITLAMKEEERRRKLLLIQNPEDAWAIFQDV